MTTPETKKHDPVPHMTKKEALDTLLRHVAEGKKDIAQGNYFTVEEARFLLRRYHESKTNK